MDRTQIRHVAALAELTLSEEEESRLVDEIGRIVAHVAELEAVDTTDVPATAHVTATPDNVFRDDAPVPSLSNADALAGAPRAEHGGFSVPVFVE